MCRTHLIGKNDIWGIFWATANLLPQKTFTSLKMWVCGDIFQYHWVKVQLAFTTEKHQSKPILICSMFLLASRFSPSTFFTYTYNQFFSAKKKTSVTSFSLVIVHKKGFLWSSYTSLYGVRMQFPKKSETSFLFFWGSSRRLRLSLKSRFGVWRLEYIDIIVVRQENVSGFKQLKSLSLYDIRHLGN